MQCMGQFAYNVGYISLGTIFPKPNRRRYNTEKLNIPFNCNFIDKLCDRNNNSKDKIGQRKKNHNRKLTFYHQKPKNEYE
jgi:hypothetical protein